MKEAELVRKALGIISRRSEPGAQPTRDWLEAWRTLARLTDGIIQEDPRFQPVLEALSRCDERFLRNDWAGFLEQVGIVEKLILSKG